MCCEKRTYETIPGAYRLRFGNPGGRKLGNLEVWSLGGLEEAQQRIYECILGAYRKRFRNPGVLEARNLEFWRLGDLGEALERLRTHPGSL